MNKLLLISSLMNRNKPEASRQSLLLGALGGSVNPMIEYLTARQVSESAHDADRVDPEKIKVDAAAILAHLYRQPGATDAQWAAWLAGLRAAIEATLGDDDKTHLDQASEDGAERVGNFLARLISEDDAIAPEIKREFDAVLQQLERVVGGLEQRQHASANGNVGQAAKAAKKVKTTTVGKDLRGRPVPLSARTQTAARKAVDAVRFTPIKK
jgi:hypothetical protein